MSRNLFIVVLFFGLLALGGYFYYTQYYLIDLPADRVLQNQEGQKLEVQVLARDETQVRIRSNKDDQIYHIDIADLSQSDQVFLRRVRESTLPPLPPPTPSEPEPVNERIALREREIARLQDNMERLRLEVQSGTLSQGFINDRNRKIAETAREIQELKAEIGIIRLDEKK